MDYLWTPWRYAYVKGCDQAPSCIFCDAIRCQDDRKAHILLRAQHCFIILNAFPYTSGHAMILPYAHLDQLSSVATEAAHELIALTQRMETVLRQTYHPEGINLGMNLGKAAGAGVTGHVHMHILPRWTADANFITVIGETRVIPEDLDTTYDKLSAALRATQ